MESCLRQTTETFRMKMQRWKAMQESLMQNKLDLDGLLVVVWEIPNRKQGVVGLTVISDQFVFSGVGSSPSQKTDCPAELSSSHHSGNIEVEPENKIDCSFQWWTLHRFRKKGRTTLGDWASWSQRVNSLFFIIKKNPMSPWTEAERISDKMLKVIYLPEKKQFQVSVTWKMDDPPSTQTDSVFLDSNVDVNNILLAMVSL